MKLKEISVKKGMVQRLTIKGTSGSYKSNEKNAEVTLTFEGEDLDEFEANKKVRKALADLVDEDEDWIKDPQKAGATKYKEVK